MPKIETNSRLSQIERNSIINSIRLYYKFVDKDVEQNGLPTHDVIVYSDSVKLVEGESDTFEAMVKISVDFCGSKSHKVHIKFKVKNFNILPVTLEYL